jgi:hypothetical protein
MQRLAKACLTQETGSRVGKEMKGKEMKGDPVFFLWLALKNNPAP